MTSATTRTTWRRLKRNNGALIGITIIVLSILAALFAYLLAPDGSPNANRMIVEILCCNVKVTMTPDIVVILCCSHSSYFNRGSSKNGGVAGKFLPHIQRKIVGSNKTIGFIKVLQVKFSRGSSFINTFSKVYLDVFPKYEVIVNKIRGCLFFLRRRDSMRLNCLYPNQGLYRNRKQQL